MTAMDSGARAWMIVVAKNHYWRLAHYYDLDDILQDGHMIWYKIINKYETQPNRVRSRGHLMRLFKRSFLNHLHDLSKKRTKQLAEISYSGKAASNLSRKMDRSDQDNMQTQKQFDDFDEFARDIGELDLLIAEAPAFLRPLLRKLIDDNPSWSSYRVRLDGTRETVNERWCRYVGYGPNFPLRERLLEFLHTRLKS